MSVGLWSERQLFMVFQNNYTLIISPKLWVRMSIDFPGNIILKVEKVGKSGLQRRKTYKIENFWIISFSFNSYVIKS
jgi:hypothetical protein